MMKSMSTGQGNGRLEGTNRLVSNIQTTLKERREQCENVLVVNIPNVHQVWAKQEPGPCSDHTALEA